MKVRQVAVDPATKELVAALAARLHMTQVAVVGAAVRAFDRLTQGERVETPAEMADRLARVGDR